MNILELITDLRCGVSKCCDFCKKPFTQENYPTPEEGDMWACIECVTRWDNELKEKNT